MNAIEIRNLGKKYVIAHQDPGPAGHDTLRDALADALRFSRKRAPAGSREEIWALKNITLDIASGERVGIIGRNGAGKSTLLKILCRITEPTEGEAIIRGRVSSLLEVGTGFHAELTGRENIFLNGAVLGMKKQEIERKFDEIVAFSGVEKFLDTPVKRYSSGMRVRLAFAVAAHLEPEIMLVDEVLAVGDAEFQKKCLGKMDQVSRQEGRTILFVSHNMAAIQALCNRAVFFSSGSVAADGPVEDVVREYIGSVEQVVSEVPLAEREDREGGDIFRFTKVEFLDAITKKSLPVILSGQDVLMRIHYYLREFENIDNVVIVVFFYSNDGRYLFGCNNEVLNHSYNIKKGPGFFSCRIPRFPLPGGRYRYLLKARRRMKALDRLEDAGHVEVEDGDFFGTHKKIEKILPGVLVDFEWI